MEIITILSLINLILIVVKIISTNKLITDFKEENKELSLQLDNSEKRVVEHSRKIKAIEDIIVHNEKNNEFDTITLKQIKKELFASTTQAK